MAEEKRLTKFNIDFMGKRKIFGVLSVLLVIASVFAFFTKGLKYGVDFRGGAEVQVNFQEPVEIEKIRQTLEGQDFEGVEVQRFGDPSRNEYLMKVPVSQEEQGGLNEVAAMIGEAFRTSFSETPFEISRVDIVGSKAGKELRFSGFQALFWAILAIFIYVTLRFDSRFAPGAVIALAHDALLVIFVWVIFGKEFSLQTVAAILAVIGYSVNDTVVIFDRIRETNELTPGTPLIDVMNRSINETLGRTLITSVTTIFVVASLLFLGGEIIADFALALLVGNIAGVYSTIYVASNVTLVMDRFYQKKGSSSKKKARRSRRPQAFPEVNS
jgi:preprotein translocase subunit SecF